MLKRPKLTVNLWKVLFGVAFSLVWAKVMYIIWPQPSYVTFIWFYLGLGSVLLKWVFFEVIDRVHGRLRRRVVERRLAESGVRVEEAGRAKAELPGTPPLHEKAPDIGDKVTIKGLEDDVMWLGGLVESAIRRSLKALTKGDMDLARAVVQEDRVVNETEFAIRGKCIEVVGGSSLGIGDVRRIVSFLGIITELERMGDYGEGIAKIALMIGGRPSPDQIAGIAPMGDWGLKMLKESLASLSQRDVELAERVCRMDDEVDSLYDRAFRALRLMIIEDPNSITRGTWLVWAAHNLERLADRATNICEWVAFAESGEMLDIGASKY
ncbi:MAG: phosphate signaling complex protein PhoU [Chloroflexota bacterium]